jgi:hypothetical protein
MPGSAPLENPSEDQQDLRKSKLWNPLALGIIAAVIGLIGNSVVTFLQGQQDIDLKEREFQNTVDIEARKFKSSLFIEAIKTGNLESASRTLQFLLGLGFIDDPTRTIKASLEDPSKIPVLPSNAPPLPNPIDERWRTMSGQTA